MTPQATAARPLSWFGVFRLGLVQAGIGAVTVLATSTLSRLMTVELALPALVPGALVAMHYLVQLARPHLGHGSDRSGRRGLYVVGGMAVTALGLVSASAGVALWKAAPGGGAALLVAGFLLFGAGVSGCGVALLALLAERTAPGRRGPAATVTWIMMMVGFIVSAGITGAALKPYSGARLVEVSIGVGVVAILLAWLGVVGLERRGRAAMAATSRAAIPFMEAFRAIWAEPATRRLAAVVFLAMLAYAGQELVLEPLAGAVFGASPGASTQLMGLQRSGALLGMIGFGAVSGLSRGRLFSLSTALGVACAAAALALALLAFGALRGPGFPLRPVVVALGLADGVFATAAIGAMMAGTAGGDGRAGLRLGVWGAAQAVANAVGGLLATGALQAGRSLWSGAPGPGYALTFALQAVLFAGAAGLVVRLSRRATDASPSGVFAADPVRSAV